MPHIEETLKQQDLAAGKPIAMPIPEGMMNKDEHKMEEHSPTMFEKITDPVKNLFQRDDSTECEKKEEHCDHHHSDLDMMNGSHKK